MPRTVREDNKVRSGKNISVYKNPDDGSKVKIKIKNKSAKEVTKDAQGNKSKIKVKVGKDGKLKGGKYNTYMSKQHIDFAADDLTEYVNKKRARLKRQKRK